MLMAQQERFPPEVKDIILQHHGVTPVMFFYHKALQMANGNPIDINDFRYGGPKPQTKEAAIVMMADTIEAAVRSMKDPTPKAIDQFIERLIRGKLEDGQLSDSPLSLRDIDQICEAFSGILKGVYHGRIEYPKVSKTMMEVANASVQAPAAKPADAAQTRDAEGEGNSPDPAADSRQEADAVKAPVPEQAIPTEENGASEPVKEETPESMMEKAD